MSLKIGRLASGEVGKEVLHDAPEKQMAAVMSKLDELIAAVKALDLANTSVPEVVALKEIVLHL